MNPTDTGGLLNTFLLAMISGGGGFWGNRYGGYGNDGGYGGYGRGGYGEGYATDLASFQTALQSNGVNNSTIMSAIEGNEEALEALSKSLDLSTTQIQSVLAKVNDGILTMAGQFQVTAKDITAAIAAGDYQLSRQLADCCCENRLASERNLTAINANALVTQNAIKDQTATILADAKVNTQAILDRMTQDTIDGLRGQLDDAKDDANTQAILAAIGKKP